jgi:hypothetical protein
VPCVSISLLAAPQLSPGVSKERRCVIEYAGGTEAQLGDRVEYHGEPSIVEAVVDSAEQCATWGVSQRGLMLKNALFGLVFAPVGSAIWDCVVYLGRRG